MTFTLPTKFPYEARMRNGEKAIVVGVHPIRGILMGYEGENCQCWFGNGLFSTFREKEHELDLLGPWVEPVAVEFWFNIYPNGSDCCASSSKEAADRWAKNTRIACRKLRFKDGRIEDVTEEV